MTRAQTFGLTIAVVATVSSVCGESPSDDLSWIEHADAKVDFRCNVEEQKDTRFIALCGLALRVPGAEDYNILVGHYGYRCITSCWGRGKDYRRQLDMAQEYARQYNEMLLEFFYSN